MQWMNGCTRLGKTRYGNDWNENGIQNQFQFVFDSDGFTVGMVSEW